MVAQKVPQEGGGLVEAARPVLRGAVGAQQVAVGGAGALDGGGVGGELGGGGAQQALGLLDVPGDEFLGQVGVRLAVGGGVPFGLAAQPAELLARCRRPGFQHLYEGLGARRRGLPGGAVGAVGAFEELGGPGAHLVREPVEFGEGGALVAFGAGLFGAQVGADADLLVEPGGGPVGLAQVGEGRLGRAVVLGEGSGAPAMSARSARSARAVRRASSAARCAARRSSSAARARSRHASARASDSAASSASSRSRACQPERSRKR